MIFIKNKTKYKQGQFWHLPSFYYVEFWHFTTGKKTPRAAFGQPFCSEDSKKFCSILCIKFGKWIGTLQNNWEYCLGC